MLIMRTTEDPANPVCKLVSSQQTLGLYDLALAVYPLGLDRVQPRALLWAEGSSRSSLHQPLFFDTSGCG